LLDVNIKIMSPSRLGKRHWVSINRAPVLTLWAAVVAERLGFKKDEALTLGRAVAGLNAYSKGKSLGLFEPTPSKLKEERHKARTRKNLTVMLLNRAVPVERSSDGLRALSKDSPIKPESVQRYLEGKFGDALDESISAMRHLAWSMPPKRLSANAYKLYEQFRPEIPSGVTGWGAKGRLDIDAIRNMAN
jgi:hypothetical protein